MKSILGSAAALCVAAAFALAYWFSARAGASWLDAQWLFLAALPYNWTTLKIAGSSNFSPDSPFQVASAAAAEAAAAYLVGAAVEWLARRLAFRRRA